MTLQNAGWRALDVLFPKRCAWCGKVLGFTADACGCDKSREAVRLPNAPLATPDLEGEAFFPIGAWACFAYEEPVRGMILRMKYEEEPALAQPLAQELAQKYDASGLAGQFDVLIPVPMTPKALKKRGYNQCALMAGALAVHAGLPCEEAALRKTRHTERQMALDRAGRLQNVRDAFTAEAGVAGKRILLVDDVFTTGSTANECAKSLQAAGAAACGVLCVAASLIE